MRRAENSGQALDPQEFVRRWTIQHDAAAARLTLLADEKLLRYPAYLLEDLDMPPGSHAFLTEAGLPTKAAPLLSFFASSGPSLPCVAAEYSLPKRFRGYREIGSLENGDPICLDEDEECAIVILRQREEYRRVPMNRTVPQLGACLLAYQEAIDATVTANGEGAFVDGDIPPAVRRDLARKLHEIEPTAMMPGCFWRTECDILGEW